MCTIHIFTNIQNLALGTGNLPANTAVSLGFVKILIDFIRFEVHLYLYQNNEKNHLDCSGDECGIYQFFIYNFQTHHLHGQDR